jgi:hypothetical protein
MTFLLLPVADVLGGISFKGPDLGVLDMAESKG